MAFNLINLFSNRIHGIKIPLICDEIFAISKFASVIFFKSGFFYSFAALIEQLGGKPIADISESLGGWPVVKGDMWDPKDTWTWQETIKKFRRLGLSMDYIVDFSISVDLKNSTTRVIDVSVLSFS